MIAAKGRARRRDGCVPRAAWSGLPARNPPAPKILKTWKRRGGSKTPVTRVRLSVCATKAGGNEIQRLFPHTRFCPPQIRLRAGKSTARGFRSPGETRGSRFGPRSPAVRHFRRCRYTWDEHFLRDCVARRRCRLCSRSHQPTSNPPYPPQLIFPRSIFFLMALPPWYTVASTIPETAKSPPTMAHAEVRKCRNDRRLSDSSTLIGLSS